MSARRIFPTLLLTLLTLMAALGTWMANWMIKRPIAPSGGLYFVGRVVLPGPHFLQGDPAWAEDKLGPTTDTMASAGCAVSSAAMVLAAYGVDTNPGQLNAYLKKSLNGYSAQGWIHWDTAAKISPTLAAEILPHYEDQPSYFLIDWNLLNGNPVIIRYKYNKTKIHFLVICGKSGSDYIVRDPGSRGKSGLYPLPDFPGTIDALRFYRKPAEKSNRSQTLPNPALSAR